jgi:hypothetical protein
MPCCDVPRLNFTAASTKGLAGAYRLSLRTLVCNHALSLAVWHGRARDFKSVEHYRNASAVAFLERALLWDAAASTKPGQGTYMGCS